MNTADDRHLSVEEIGQLLDGSLAPERSSHTAECAACSHEVEAFRLVKAHVRRAGRGAFPTAAAGCPSAETMARLACGSLPEEEVTVVMTHIENCERCATILQAVTGSGEEPAIATEPQAAVVALPAPRPMGRRFALWVGIVAAVLIAAISSLIWTQRRNDPAELLAQAYTASRPFDYRLPDGGHAPVRQARTGGASALDRPLPLIQAEQTIQQRLQADPDSAEWLLLRGRAELLEGQFDAAVESLTQAREANPNDPAILSDLGCAYALRGDAEQRSTDYGAALDALMRSLQLLPGQRPALFNLALVQERLSLIEEAIETWDRLLDLEPSGGWAEEARRRRNTLQQQVDRRNEIRQLAAPDAQAFLALVQNRKRDIQPEVFQDTAWQVWLPQAGDTSAAAASALAQMFSEQFGDTSLQNALAARETTLPGLQLLAQASQWNVQGSYDKAAELAQLAVTQLTANPAARFRARLEWSYAAQRNSFSDCLAVAGPLRRDLAATGYRWMLAQATLQEGICFYRVGDDRGRDLYAEALALSERAKIPILRLRAVGFLAGIDGATGNLAAAWSKSVEGLRSSWTIAAPPARAQQFATNLAETAHSLQWRTAAPVFRRASVRETVAIGNRQIETLNRIYLASALLASGETAAAEREIEQAEIISASLPPSPTVRNLLQDARLTMAGQATADVAATLASLADIEKDWPEAPWSAKLDLQQITGRLRFSQGEIEAAANAFRRAIDLHRAEMRTLDEPLKRIDASDRAGAAYRGLAEIQLTAGKDARAALATWDTYRQSVVSASRTPSTSPPGAAALVYAVLPRGVAAWVVRGDSISGRMLATPAEELQRRVERFRKQCANPDSDLKAARAEGRELFRLLIDPLLPSLTGTKLLIIDADGWIAGVPFPALVGPQGRYLIEDAAIALADRHASSGGVPVLDRALIVSAASPGGSDTRRFPPLPSADLEVHHVAAMTNKPVVLTGARATPEGWKRHLPGSAVFHFAGHGWSNGGGGGLVLPAPGPGREPIFLDAARIVQFDWRGVELVVLSACMTGAGEVRGSANPQSLVRALLASGARRVVATRWDVDSPATTQWMRDFYASLKQGGSTAAAAARAGSGLLADPAHAHPYYWASFAVFGEL